jgi:hypothetical protein
MSTREFGKDVQTAVDYAIRRGLELRAGDDWRAKVEVDGHAFWIHPIRVSNLEPEVKAVAVRLHLTHLRPGSPDEQVHYTAVIHDGAMLFQELTIDDGGGLFGLLEALATAAVRDFSGLSIKPSVLMHDLAALLTGDSPSAARYLVAVAMLRLAEPKEYVSDAGYPLAGRRSAVA